MKVIVAHGGRFGPGKIHAPRSFESSNAVHGLTACGRYVYGEVSQESENPVTCQHCITRDHP